MTYYLDILYRLEKKNVVNVIINILCLSLGFLIAIIFMSQASSACIDYMTNKRYMPLDDYLICIPQVESTRILKSDLDKIVSDYKEVDNIQVYNNLNDEMVVFQESFCPEISVKTVTEGYCNIFENDYLIGENISDKRSAIIGEQVAEQYGIKIGDAVEFANYKFYICGILFVPQYKNSVLVWADAIENGDFFDCQYYVKIELVEKDSFSKYLESNYGNYEIYTGKEYTEIQKDRLLTGWLFSIVMAIVTICYGLINIYNIESFFVLKQKREIAILRALGASQSSIMIAKMIRSLIIAIVSSSVTTLGVCLLEHTELTDLIDFHMTFFVYLISTVMIMGIYVFFSYVLYRIHYRKEIVKIISQI